MFFVRKDNIGTALGTQKEYAAAQRRGVLFHSDHLDSGNSVIGQINICNIWHYLWPRELIEPSMRSTDAQFFIWSQEVGPSELIGEPIITPYTPSDPAAPANEDDLEMENQGHEMVPAWLLAARAAWLRASDQPRHDAQPQVS